MKNDLGSDLGFSVCTFVVRLLPFVLSRQNVERCLSNIHLVLKGCRSMFDGDYSLVSEVPNDG